MVDLDIFFIFLSQTKGLSTLYTMREAAGIGVGKGGGGAGGDHLPTLGWKGAAPNFRPLLLYFRGHFR